MFLRSRVDFRAFDDFVDHTVLDRVFDLGLYLFLLSNLDTRGLPRRLVA